MRSTKPFAFPTSGRQPGRCHCGHGVAVEIQQEICCITPAISPSRLPRRLAPRNDNVPEAMTMRPSDDSDVGFSRSCPGNAAARPISLPANGPPRRSLPGPSHGTLPRHGVGQPGWTAPSGCHTRGPGRWQGARPWRPAPWRNPARSCREQVARELLGEPPVAAAAVGNRISQRFKVHAGFDTQRQRLGHQHADAHGQQVVADFGNHPGADVPAVDDVSADGIEQRLDLLEGCPVAAGHHRQRARCRTVHPPLTGASSTVTPRAAHSSCRRRITVGELVDRST